MKNIKICSVALQHTSINTQPDNAATVEVMLKRIRSAIEAVAPDNPDLILLPEYCDIPDNYDNIQKRAYCAARGDKLDALMQNTAVQLGCWVAYNTIRPFGEAHYNSTILLNRSGDVATIYDKNYPYLPEMDEGLVLPGKTAEVFECELGRIAFATCFDLNFDELWQRYKGQSPNLILFSSMFHGSFLQQQRTFELRSHFVSAISWPIPSVALSPVGSLIASTTNYRNHFTATLNLDYAVLHLDFNIDKFPAIFAKYGEKVRIDDPAMLASAVLYSESPDFTATDIVREFGLETLDDYLDRCRRRVKA